MTRIYGIDTLAKVPSWLVVKIHFFDCLPAREKFFKVVFFSKKARSYSPMYIGARGHFCDSKNKRYLGTKYRACHYRESMIKCGRSEERRVGKEGRAGGEQDR